MITDAMMAQAAAELANAIYDSSPEPSACKHQFSPRFERKMRHLIRKANHPVFYRALRSVASIVFAIILGLGSFLAINAEAREIVFGWIKQQFQNFYMYSFVGEVDSTGETESTETVRYQPGWMPDGCVFVTSYGITGGEVYIYTNEKGSLIKFTYASDTDTTRVFMDGVKYKKESVLVNGLPGEIYLSANEGKTSEIVWINADDHTLFLASGNFSAAELLKIAESIKKIN